MIWKSGNKIFLDHSCEADVRCEISFESGQFFPERTSFSESVEGFLDRDDESEDQRAEEQRIACVRPSLSID